MPPVGFEPTILAGERPQTYALVRVATGIGTSDRYEPKIDQNITCAQFHPASITLADLTPSTHTKQGASWYCSRK